MSRLVDIELAEKWLHREDHGTPDETWRPESEFCAMLDALPTVETAPVVYARWVPKKDGRDPVVCGACGAPALYAIVENEWGDEEVILKRSDRCPSCGAFMTEKEEKT